MGKIYEHAYELIGKTPLIRLQQFAQLHGVKAELIAKLESRNPAGSAKDRVARQMIEAAEAEGSLKPGATIIEPTSGNTGIGLAFVAAAKGYHCIFTMPDTMSVERIKLLQAYGAEIVLTPGELGMAGSIQKAEELHRQIENSMIPGQFINPENPAAHYKTTGPEIWEDTQGEIDIFVAGVGTGGTVSGVGAYLKKQNPKVKVVAVEPSDSPLLSTGKAGPHKIQGIGANFVPQNFKRDVIDEILTIKSEDAFATAQNLAQAEGLLVGISSGAAQYAATLLAARPENKGKVIVALLPDTGERYLSTPGFVK